MKIKKWYMGKGHYVMYIVLTGILLLSVFVLPETLAKYRGEETGTANARVACVNGEVQGESFQFDLEKMVPGETRSYPFSITNFTGDKISETAQTYEFNLKTGSNLPFTFLVKDQDNKIVPFTVNGKKSDETMSTVENSMWNFFGTKERETHHYTLEVTWDNSNQKLQDMNEIDYVQLIIKVNQADQYEKSGGAS